MTNLLAASRLSIKRSFGYIAAIEFPARRRVRSHIQPLGTTVVLGHGVAGHSEPMKQNWHRVSLFDASLRYVVTNLLFSSYL